MKRIGYIAAQRIKSLKGQHICWDTADSDKTIRLNSRTYSVAASIIGVQTKPRAGVAMTDEIIGMESMPGINSGFTGKGIVCFKAEPYLGSTAGALSGDVRGYEVSLGKPSGAGTISGTMSGVKFINNANGTITGGIYPIYVLTHGDTLAWSGFAKLPDDDQIADDDATGTGTITGWIKVTVGSSTRYIYLYTAAPA
jgi:hypothetical protein